MYVPRIIRNIGFIARNYFTIRRQFPKDSFELDIQYTRGRFLVDKIKTDEAISEKTIPWCDFGKNGHGLYLTQYLGNGNGAMPPGFLDKLVNKTKKRITRNTGKELQEYYYDPNRAEAERKLK